jgi:DNA-binding transcriptional LysR family regulator
MLEFDEQKIRRLDGGLLLVFRELLLRRRATEAAERLGLSPSAVSHALGRLRELMGDPLFIRRSHGLEPTQRAIELGPRVEALLGQIAQTLSGEAAFDPGSSRRRFRIACAEDFATLVGDRLVASFQAQAPRASVFTRWAILERALRAVRRGEADLAIGVFDRVPRGFETSTLYEDDYCVIARKGHPTVRGSVDAATYATVGHVFVGTPDGAFADEAPLDREALDATYGSIPDPRLVRTHAYVTQWETAMLIVGGSDVLADCPRRLARRFADRLNLQILDSPFRPFRFKVQAIRRGELADGGVDWLLGRLREALDD